MAKVTKTAINHEAYDKKNEMYKEKIKGRVLYLGRMGNNIQIQPEVILLSHRHIVTNNLNR